MTVGELVKLLIPAQADEVFRGIEVFSQRLNETIKMLTPPVETQKKLATMFQAFVESAKDGSTMQSAVLFYAERRLEELELPKDIWRQLTTEMSFGTLSFSATPEAEKILGDKVKSRTSEWTGWEAAQLACAANAALSTEDKGMAYALGYFIGGTIDEDQEEKIKGVVSELIENQHKEKSSKGGLKKGADNIPLYELLKRLTDLQKNVSPKEILKLLANPKNKLVQTAIAQTPTIPISLVRLDREKQTLHFIVEGRARKLSLNRIRRNLTEQSYFSTTQQS